VEKVLTRVVATGFLNFGVLLEELVEILCDNPVLNEDNNLETLNLVPLQVEDLDQLINLAAVLLRNHRKPEVVYDARSLLQLSGVLPHQRFKHDLLLVLEEL